MMDVLALVNNTPPPVSMNFGWSRYFRLAARSPLYSEIKEFTKLAIPLISAQVAQSAIGLADTLMMGRLGPETLAAGGLASMTFTIFLFTAVGVVIAVSPIVAAANGAGQKDRITQVAGQGYWLVLGLTIPNMWCVAQVEVLMRHWGLAETTVVLGNTYLDIMQWGLFPALGFALLRSVISALSEVRPVMMIMGGGTVLNVLGNYVLGFGKWGFPRLEIAGLAISSVFTLWMMFLALVIYIWKNPALQKYRLLQPWPPLNFPVFQEIFWLGLPIGLSITLEFGLFITITYLMGRLGTNLLAAHQIVFQTVTITFMAPLGMSQAATIRVAQRRGRRDQPGIRRAGQVSLALGAGCMMILSIAFLIFPKQIIGCYLDLANPQNAAVIAVTRPILQIAAGAQILDGLQKIAMGALYGLQDTKMPTLLSLVAFWGVGLTSGYLLGFQTNWGGVGLWIGQSIGVAIAALLFIWRFYYLTTIKRS
jgi:multidrug resistance protein, MATE family